MRIFVIVMKTDQSINQIKDYELYFRKIVRTVFGPRKR